jgi:Ca2+-binding RTX toxin-like protein
LNQNIKFKLNNNSIQDIVLDKVLLDWIFDEIEPQILNNVNLFDMYDFGNIFILRTLITPEYISCNQQEYLPESNVIQTLSQPPNDILFSEQWYLQTINVEPVWDDYTGEGIRIGVFESTDNGNYTFDYNHVDLNDNVDQEWLNKLNNGEYYESSGKSSHATMVAGIIAAEKNGEGVVGVAYDSTIGSHKYTHRQYVKDYDVVNNSWGYSRPFNTAFTDDFWDYELNYLRENVVLGRDGLGTNMVFGAGNDRAQGWDVNYSNYMNSRFAITVGGIKQSQEFAYSSNPGSALFITAPSIDISSTDINDEYDSGSGTSYSSPIISGVIALMLEANPDLGYRDVQQILAYSSIQNDSSQEEWDFNTANNWNGAGLHFNDNYGFGMVDALAAARLAETWTNISIFINEDSIEYFSQDTLNIPDNSILSINIDIQDQIEIEHVELHVDMDHPYLNDLIIKLISPSGLESVLLDRVDNNYSLLGMQIFPEIDYSFSSAKYRGENSQGTWQVEIIDEVTGNVGVLDDFSLKIFGKNDLDNNVYIYTNEYTNFAADNSRTTLEDLVGYDVINTSAVSDDVLIDLSLTTQSSIAGQDLVINSNTQIESVFTGDGNDLVYGNDLDNILYAGRGNDEISGNTGKDILVGGSGQDSLTGGEDSDIFIIEFDIDSIDYILDFNYLDFADYIYLIGFEAINQYSDLTFSETGNDVSLFLSATQSLVFNNSNLTEISSDYFSFFDDFGFQEGSSWFDLGAIRYVSGTESSETIEGYTTNDEIRGNAGNDSISGAAGDDTIYAGLGDDTIIGGYDNSEENDLVIFSGLIEDYIITITEDGVLFEDTQPDRDGLDLLKNIKSVQFSNTDILLLEDLTENLLFGSQNADTLIGSDLDDFISGGAGQDSIEGNQGNDTIYGGDGDDLIEGGYYGEDGENLIYGDAGNDKITLYDGNNIIYGGDGDDYITGLYGFSSNVVDGGEGNDLIMLDHYSDSIYSSSGEDTIIGSKSYSFYDYYGDSNFADVVIFSANQADYEMSITTTGILFSDLRQNGDDTELLKNIKYIKFADTDNLLLKNLISTQINGTDAGDSILGTCYSETIYGGSGDDTIVPNDGFDEIHGGLGNDIIDARYETIIIDSEGSYGDKEIYGEEGNDTLFGSNEADTIYGGIGDDYIETGTCTSKVYGNEGNDYIFIMQGSNTIFAGPGEDIIVDNFNYIDNDVVVFSGNQAEYEIEITNQGIEVVDTVSNRDDITILRNVQNIEFADTGVVLVSELVDQSQFMIYGTLEDDEINGTDESDSIYGDAGDDILNGAAGDDILYCGQGNDSVASGVGNDTIYGETGNDYLFGWLGENVIYGGEGNDTIKGLSGNELLFGDLGDDSIMGHYGNDTIYGGEGNDFVEALGDYNLLYGEEGNDTIKGGSDNDSLYGGDGDDLLSDRYGNNVFCGGLGNDTLDGTSPFINEGEDLFIIEKGLTGEIDIILGFRNYGLDDKIDLTSFTRITSFSHLNMVEDGNDVIITFDNGQVLKIEMYSIAELLVDNFIFQELSLSVINPDSETYTEDINLNFADIVIDSGTSDTVDVSLTLSDISAGTLIIGTSGQVTSIFTNGVWQASGAIADVNALLADLEFMPTENYNSNFNIALSVDDGINTEYTDTINMTGTPVNDTPEVAIEITNQAVIVGEELNFDVSANFIDIDGDDLTYTAELVDGSVLSSWLDFDASTQIFSGTPIGGDDGVISVKVVADDGNSSIEDIFDITINLENNIPTVLESIDDQSLRYGQSLFLDVSDKFIDIEDNSLNFSAKLGNGDSLPDWLNINSETGVLSGTPYSGRGTFTIDVTASDSNNASVSQTFEIDVRRGGFSPTLGDDNLVGGWGNDTIYGGEGNDTLEGGWFWGKDKLYGGDGEDLLLGEFGKDTLSGGAGEDTLYGGFGKDKLYGGAGNDTLYGEEENDTLSGGAGEDRLYGSIGKDKVYGGEGDDYLNGGWGNDRLYGEEGDDDLNGSYNNDKLYGGQGNDTLRGSTGDDKLTGEAGADVLIGGKGDDIFNFSSLKDSTISETDIINDFQQGGNFWDWLQGNVGEDVIDVSDLGFTGIQEGAAEGSVLGYEVIENGSFTHITADDVDFSIKLIGEYDLTDSDFIFS